MVIYQMLVKHMVQALIQARKPEAKVYDDLAEYNAAIDRSFQALLET